MEELPKLAREVLEDSYLMTIAVSTPDGPWASDVVFVHDEEMNVYWRSLTATRHSQAIAESGIVALSITAEDEPNKERAIQMRGKALQVANVPEEIEEALREKWGVTTVGGPSSEKVWYAYTPTEMWVIHNEMFGYDRQEVPLGHTPDS